MHPTTPTVDLRDERDDPDELTPLLSEPALADWNRPEEDAAWSHLQGEA